MSQYAELKAQIARLQAQADEARRTELGNVIEEIRGKIAEYGLTAQDLGFAVAARRGRPQSGHPDDPGSYRGGKGARPRQCLSGLLGRRLRQDGL